MTSTWLRSMYYYCESKKHTLKMILSCYYDISHSKYFPSILWLQIENYAWFLHKNSIKIYFEVLETESELKWEWLEGVSKIMWQGQALLLDFRYSLKPFQLKFQFHFKNKLNLFPQSSVRYVKSSDMCLNAPLEG